MIFKFMFIDTNINKNIDVFIACPFCKLFFSSICLYKVCKPGKAREVQHSLISEDRELGKMTAI